MSRTVVSRISWNCDSIFKIVCDSSFKIEFIVIAVNSTGKLLLLETSSLFSDSYISRSPVSCGCCSDLGVCSRLVISEWYCMTSDKWRDFPVHVKFWRSAVRFTVGFCGLRYCERSLHDVSSKKRRVLCLWLDKQVVREVLSWLIVARL